MDRIEANQFAANWISAWNRKDVNAVLEHYIDEAKFIGPKAATFVGNPVVEGKKALSHWQLAAEKIEKIEFRLDHIVWDSESKELEPISKTPEEDNKAGELDKAEEVLGVVLPADEDATLPLYPSEETLDEPPSHITA
jgi:hypothetical protein